MKQQHEYQIQMRWTGNQGSGTSSYDAYTRDHIYSINGKPEVHGSSDPSFRGNPSKHNPEELLVASLSSCHMLWYLHLCSVKGIIVESYEDDAHGKMITDASGGGRFTEVILSPKIRISSTDKVELAHTLHEEANKLCFIANSCNFPVLHHPVIEARN